MSMNAIANGDLFMPPDAFQEHLVTLNPDKSLVLRTSQQRLHDTWSVIDGQEDPSIFFDKPDSSSFDQGVIYGKAYEEIKLLNPRFFFGDDYVKVSFVRIYTRIR